MKFNSVFLFALVFVFAKAGSTDDVDDMPLATKNTIQMAANYRKTLIGEQQRKFDEFMTFIADYNKAYADDAEIADRFAKFQASEERVRQRQNETGPDDDVEFGVTKFSDMSPEEFLDKYACAKAASVAEFHAIAEAEAPYNGSQFVRAPAAFDWRSRNGVTGVRSQGRCGSCYAFAAIAAVEALHAIVNGKKMDLSEQQALSCTHKDPEYRSNGCSGGYGAEMVQWIIKNGITSEANFRYVSGSNPNNIPPCKKPPVAARASGISALPAYQENNMRDRVYTHGPIITCVDLQPLHDYKRGILSNKGENSNHVVLIVGYGTSEGKDHWNVKNSWGANWGEQGYFRVQRNINALLIAEYNYQAHL